MKPQQVLDKYMVWSHAGNKLYEGFVVANAMEEYGRELLKWFIEEENMNIKPTDEDIDSYIKDFNNAL